MDLGFHKRQIAAILKRRDNFELAAKYVDAYVDLPRPSMRQNLTSGEALRAYLVAHARVMGGGVLTAANLALVYSAYHTLELALRSPGGALLALLGMAAVGAGVSEFERAWSPYYKFKRSESQGTARWALPGDLKTRNMLLPRGEKAAPDYLPLAGLGRKHQVVLPAEMAFEHMAFFGPPGSGKSASFFIHQARAWAEIGAGIFLDTKGEIFKYSAHYYDNVYRLDFERPEYSDRIDLMSFCRPNPAQPGEDARLAGEIASFVIGYDPNNPKGGENPFWPLSATSMLKCLLLFMAEKFGHAPVQPGDIFRLLAVFSKQAELEARKYPKNPPPHPLHRSLMEADNPEIRAEWAPLSTLDEKTLGNIVISMTTPLACFRDPAVQTIFSPPSNEERARGCRVIDFRDLRRKGTAVYVVVPEGQASRLSSVLATIFGVAMNVLRRTGDAPGRCGTLVQKDEAGNVPDRNLREDIGVGRGRGIAFSFGWQDKNQPKIQYGADYAAAVLGMIGTKVALPGLTGETAKYFVELLDKTTTVKKTVNDVRNDAFDSERLDEVGVALMSEGELRQLERHTQCIIVINNAPPIRARIPENAKAVDPNVSKPQKYVWTEEDLRQAKRDEIAERTFYEGVRRMPKLPRTAFELDHAIALGPTLSYDHDAGAWTDRDVMMQLRHKAILEYAAGRVFEPVTVDEIVAMRSRVSQLTDAFAHAPGEPELIDANMAAAVGAADVAAAGGPSATPNGNAQHGHVEPVTPTPQQADHTPAPQAPTPQPNGERTSAPPPPPPAPTRNDAAGEATTGGSNGAGAHSAAPPPPPEIKPPDKIMPAGSSSTAAPSARFRRFTPDMLRAGSVPSAAGGPGAPPSATLLAQSQAPEEAFGAAGGGEEHSPADEEEGLPMGLDAGPPA